MRQVVPGNLQPNGPPGGLGLSTLLAKIADLGSPDCIGIRFPGRRSRYLLPLRSLRIPGSRRTVVRRVAVDSCVLLPGLVS